MRTAVLPAELTRETQENLGKTDDPTGVAIEGIELIDLPKHITDSSTVIEIARLTDGKHDWLPAMPVASIGFTELLPQAINAFALNLDSDIIWFVPPSGRVLAIFHDSREGSKTKGLTQRLILGAGQAQAIQIPRGVCHGLRNLHNQTGYVVTLSGQPHDMTTQQPRLPWDFLGEAIFEPTKG